VTSGTSDFETETISVPSGTMAITSVEPNSGHGGDSVTYTGYNLGSVRGAVFQDGKGNAQPMSATPLADGKTATAAVPSGMAQGNGTTWLVGSGQSNSLPFNFS
jgi:hypothetical protein